MLSERMNVIFGVSVFMGAFRLMAVMVGTVAVVVFRRFLAFVIEFKMMSVMLARVGAETAEADIGHPPRSRLGMPAQVNGIRQRE